MTSSKFDPARMPKMGKQINDSPLAVGFVMFHDGDAESVYEFGTVFAWHTEGRYAVTIEDEENGELLFVSEHGEAHRVIEDLSKFCEQKSPSRHFTTWDFGHGGIPKKVQELADAVKSFR